VVAQMSAGDGFGCGADVGRGWTFSQCKGGQGIDSVQLQIWVGGGLGPGADVGGYEPSPVVSDERSPKMHMRAYRGELCQAALRCAHTQLVLETCSLAPSGRKTRVHRRATIVPQVCPDKALRPPSPRSEGFGCGLRPVAAVTGSGAEAAAAADGVGFVAAASRDCAGMQQLALHCSGLRCAATDAAACNCRWHLLRRALHCCRRLQAALRCNKFRLSGWAHSRGAQGLL
jgi:hypothetical protein